MHSEEGPNIAWNFELKKKLSEGNEKSLFIFEWRLINQTMINGEFPPSKPSPPWWNLLKQELKSSREA